MGYWGIEPWQNDGAMNWFENFFELTGIAVHLEETLSRTVEDAADEIRAAVMVLLTLEAVAWSGDVYESLATLARDRLTEMLGRGIYTNSDIIESIRSQLARLSAVLPQ